MKWLVMYINLLVNAIARLPHPQNGDNQGQETFLAPSTEIAGDSHLAVFITVIILAVACPIAFNTLIIHFISFINKR